jgi:peptidoglycan biosynthesis protein MviN/MurJ (putative lipid II flippase)
MAESETNPYASPRVPDIQSEPVAPTPAPRNLLVEIIGTVVSMVTGAFLGLTCGGNGLGFVSFVVLCSLMGLVVWIRRRRSILGTIGICILMVIVWWPFGLLIRELGRDLY